MDKMTQWLLIVAIVNTATLVLAVATWLNKR